MRTAISYIRFSSKRQRTGDSVRRQQALTEELCERHGWKLDDTLSARDLAESSFTGDQPKLQAFLALARSGQIPKDSVLIVENLDRLSRKAIKKALSLFLEILSLGIDIATHDPPRIYTDESTDDIAGLLEPLIVFARAHDESRAKSARAKHGWDRRAKLDVVGGFVPHWFDYQKPKGKWEEGKLSINKSKAKTVKLIFDLAEQGQGLKAIVKHLIKHKIESISRIAMRDDKPHKAPWSTTYVSRILSSKATIGDWQFRGETKSKYLPPIIEEAQFYKVQEIRKNTKQFTRGRPTENLFTSMLWDCQSREAFTLRGSSARECARGKEKSRRLVPRTSGGVGWYYYDFEQEFLRWLKEVNFEETKAPKLDHTAVLKGQLAEIEDELAVLATVKTTATLATKINTLDERKAEITRLLNQDIPPVTQVQQMARAFLDGGFDRSRLKNALRKVLDSIWIDIQTVEGQWQRSTKARYLYAQVFFRNGTWRQFVICHVGRRRFSMAQTNADDDVPDMDLRERPPTEKERAAAAVQISKMAETAAYRPE